MRSGRSRLLNIMVVGTKDGIVMVESGSKECSEEQVVDAIEFAHIEIKKICAAIDDLVKRAGKTKRVPAAVEIDQVYLDELSAKVGTQLKDALDTQKHPKFESYALVKEIKDALKKELPEGDAEAAKKFSKYYELLREQIFRDQVLNERMRPDHRAFDEIRPVTIEVGVLPRVHGSALFTRGETQALVTATLGTTDDAQRMESYEGEQKRRFMLHYNFPPFSVGEVGRMGGVGRREIGHGALAWRAIEAVLPARGRVAVRAARGLGHSGVERIVVDGDGVRRVAGADAGRHLAEGFGCRRGDGAGEGGRQVCRALRHCRRRRPLRRHGLQGGRHAQGHYRAADGHQDHGHHGADHARGAGPGASRAGCICWTSWTA